MNRPHSVTPVRIEALESRQFFSASPVSVGVDPLVYKAASHSHAHVGVPLLTGSPFVGTASSNSGDKASNLQLTISSETKSGGITGTLLVGIGSDNPQTYAIKGTVNYLGAFVLHATGLQHDNALITGKASADGNTLTGKYAAHEPRKPVSSGTLVLSR